MVFSEWMLEELGMDRVYGVFKIFVKRNDYLNISLILVKVTDGILFYGSKEGMNYFDTLIRKLFEVKKEIIDSTINLKG